MAISLMPASLALFKRLPDLIFTPLGSPNRQLYWSVLCALYRYRFGPDAPIPPSYGYLLHDIHKFIEDYISYEDNWTPEEDDPPETPTNTRAMAIFRRLQEAGWFRIERHGLERTVTMRPAVGQFLAELIKFAERGPIFVSGKIRLIADSMSYVSSGDPNKATGENLREAATLSRELIEHIRNTGTNVRDLIDALDPDMPTSQYVRAFFQDYIVQMFIGDYRELRTKEHPLSRRRQIIETAETISLDMERRAALIGWYAQYFANGSRTDAETMMERDLARVCELSRIEEYLDRLDEELRRANRKALAVLDYRIRSVRPLDALIQSAIANVKMLPDRGIPAVLAPGAMMAGTRLFEPRVAKERQRPVPLKKPVFSPREIALARLMQRARDARTVTPVSLSAYVARALDGGGAAASDVLPLSNIEDLRAYQTLQTVAMAQGSGSARLASNSRLLARTFDAVPTGRDELPHPYFSGRPFLIRPRQARRTDTKRGAVHE
jgi:hypothetical protein